MNYIVMKINEAKHRGVWFYVDKVLLLMCLFNAFIFGIYELIKSTRS